METKNKTFDCVEMKRRAQQALLAEFESRQQEFATLTEFLNAKITESDRASAVWARFAGGGEAGESVGQSNPRH